MVAVDYLSAPSTILGVIRRSRHRRAVWTASNIGVESSMNLARSFTRNVPALFARIFSAQAAVERNTAGSTTAYSRDAEGVFRPPSGWDIECRLRVPLNVILHGAPSSMFNALRGCAVFRRSADPTRPRAPVQSDASAAVSRPGDTYFNAWVRPHTGSVSALRQP